MSTGATFARGESRQDYSTPIEFLTAVKRRFGITAFARDLAASAENTVAGRWYGEEDDSLAQDWGALHGELWLNPPFASLAPWAEKCAGLPWPSLERSIFLLVPAAVGSNWHAKHVDGRARVLLLNGRLCFDGRNPYPKDCMLCVYGANRPRYEVWRWKP